jgi:hypothetical protein
MSCLRRECPAREAVHPICHFNDLDIGLFIIRGPAISQLGRNKLDISIWDHIKTISSSQANLLC